jgi:Zn-dependent M32 family carboxypeptidase
MDNTNMDISGLLSEIQRLQKENEELKAHVKKPSYGESQRKYYEKNKQKIMDRGAKYIQKLQEENPEKLREYRRKAQEKWRNKQKDIQTNI